MAPVTLPPPTNVFDNDLDDEGWQDMPIVREDEFASGLDEEDQKKYHYVPSAKGKSAANATGNHIDVDDYGNEWRSKLDQNEKEYTRLRVNEEEDADEVHLRTRYLFDEDKAMTPISQMQATKNLLTEAQRIAYVGLCSLTGREMAYRLRVVHRKELKAALADMELWVLKIMGRLYYHMELETREQKMIESLAEHGVRAEDLVPALMTTHTVANPEYDPEEARRQAEDKLNRQSEQSDSDDESISDQTLVDERPPSPPSKTPEPHPTSPKGPVIHSVDVSTLPATTSNPAKTTAKVLTDTSTSAIPGVSTSLSSADKNVTLDIRWTVLCDLFLILIADSVYDARSRVLLENVALKLGLGWIDVVKFESRITEALEIQEDIESLEQQAIVEKAQKAEKRRRYVMLGLATLGGGLVIGLSAGLLAPVIGAGLAGAFTTIGVTGTGAFLGGTAGAAVITTGGVLTGSGIAARGMANRTQQVRTFDILPLHNNKRVSCILTVPGFMNGINDDVRLPFSVLDPIVGDVFSVLWEPEMIRETGSALKILTGEVLSQISITVLQATVMTTLMSALQWPIILTKLGYLIDNPWSNALDRAKRAGRVLADVLIQRHLGVRPITLIGFSLGARVIFYALLELAKQKQFGVVQDVFLLGATLTASQSTWCETRSVVSGRFVNAFARNDWVLNYLFRATSGGVGTVAGLRPVQNVPGLENVDVTDKIAGHMSYRTFMPLILDQLGFPVFADYFDEPEEPDFTEARIVVREEDEKKKKSWFSRKKSKPSPSQSISKSSTVGQPPIDDDLPPRMESPGPTSPTNFDVPSKKSLSEDSNSQASSGSGTSTPVDNQGSQLPIHAGFDINAMKEILGSGDIKPHEYNIRNENVTTLPVLPATPSGERSHSTPPSMTLNTASSSRHDFADHGHDDNKVVGGTLSTSFSRSLSLDSVRSSDSKLSDEFTSLSPPTIYGKPQSASSSIQDTSFTNTPRPSHLQLSSFQDDEPPHWQVPITQSTSFTPSPLYNNANASSTFTSSYTTATQPPPFQNPFAATSYTPPVDAGLSFGTADGSITMSFAPATPSTNSDAWKVPDSVGMGNKVVQGFNANPWS